MTDRKLPVYLLLDVSGSMEGDPIVAVNSGAQMVIEQLQQDETTQSCVWISVITFADDAQQVVPLTALEFFHMPDLTAGGRTALGPALSMLCECRDREVGMGAAARGTGDYKPLVFLMTDGAQNEGDFSKGISDFRAHNWGCEVFLAAGPKANVNELKQIDNEATILKIEEATPEKLRKFFKLVTQSVKSVAKGQEINVQQEWGAGEIVQDQGAPIDT